MSLVLTPPPIDFTNPRPFVLTGMAGQMYEVARESVAAGRPISIREICRQLDLTPGAPYSHFENVEHLENVVLYNTMLELAAFINDLVDNQQEPLEMFINACHAYRRWAITNPSLFAFIFPTNGRQSNAAFSEFLHDASQAISIPTVSALTALWQSGRFPPAKHGPTAVPLEIAGHIQLTPDETRIANALWIIVHGSVVLELAFGIHDGWSDRESMFDWLVHKAITSFLL